MNLTRKSTTAHNERKNYTHQAHTYIEMKAQPSAQTNINSDALTHINDRPKLLIGPHTGTRYEQIVPNSSRAEENSQLSVRE